MLRSLAIRDFVVVAALDVEFAAGLSVLTGETGAGKSILLDALGLLLGDRFELAQLRAGASRAELAASFDVREVPAARGWLAEQALAADSDEVLLRRVLDGQGKSRAWINGSPATLAQLKELGEMLVAIHGQHAHQSLGQPETQRDLVDAFGGFTTLSREVAERWRAWRAAVERLEAAASAEAASAAEREFLAQRRRDISTLATSEDEWRELTASQSRLAHAAELIAVAGEGAAALSEADDALTARLAQLVQRLRAAAAHDPALGDVVALLEPAGIELAEAARALRDYQRRLDLDPAELRRVEDRLAAIHDMARKYRVRPETLPALLAETEARLGALAESSDAEGLARRASQCESDYRGAAGELSKKRRFHASELTHRVTEAMQTLAMAGGRFEVALTPVAAPASYGLEQVEFRVASHPSQAPGPLARVASGGELSRIALALSVVASEAGAVPTLVFDEVDSGIGGAVAATVGRLLQSLGSRRQVLCVTHLPQVAAFADSHFRVIKATRMDRVSTELALLAGQDRVEELARMLGGAEVTAKTRAHAKELFEQHKRK
ncbi:MAG TPA: DNA repair protein RecN [Casimicrobiaceae bacterium]|nr:DNA repair protein RecN [Casimicrobiaceae bacterium]